MKGAYSSGATVFFTKDCSQFLYRLYADLDHVFVVTEIVATYCDPDVRYGLVAMFPWLAAMTDSGNDELRGELIEVHSIGSGAGDSEDVIDLGTGAHKMFNLSSAGWCAVK